MLNINKNVVDMVEFLRVKEAPETTERGRLNTRSEIVLPGDYYLRTSYGTHYYKCIRIDTAPGNKITYSLCAPLSRMARESQTIRSDTVLRIVKHTRLTPK